MDDLKERIDLARIELELAQKKLYDLVSSCNHVFVKRSKRSDTCYCKICGSSGGWFCPDSPDGSCNYEHIDEDGYHTEIGGTYIDEDDCIYCHNPEERK